MYIYFILIYLGGIKGDWNDNPPAPCPQNFGGWRCACVVQWRRPWRSRVVGEHQRWIHLIAQWFVNKLMTA